MPWHSDSDHARLPRNGAGVVASVELRKSVTGMCQVADIFSNELWALWVIAAISP